MAHVDFAENVGWSEVGLPDLGPTHSQSVRKSFLPDQKGSLDILWKTSSRRRHLRFRLRIGSTSYSASSLPFGRTSLLFRRSTPSLNHRFFLTLRGANGLKTFWRPFQHRMPNASAGFLSPLVTFDSFSVPLVRLRFPRTRVSPIAPRHKRVPPVA